MWIGAAAFERGAFLNGTSRRNNRRRSGLAEGIPKIAFLTLNRGVSDHVCSCRVDIVGESWNRRATSRPKNPLAVFLSRTPPSTIRSTPFITGLGEAGSGVGALLVAVIERRIGALRSVTSWFTPIDGSTVGRRKTQPLVVAGQRQERREAGRGVVQIADAVALVECVVDPIAVGLDAVAVERRRPRSVIGRRRNRGLPLVERSDAGFAADRDRRAAHAGLRTMLMTPPIALSPYSTAPLLPRVISMRSIESRGMVEISPPAMSMSFTLRPLIRIRVLEVANAPNPRRSTLVFAPFTPPYRLVSCTPGVCTIFLHGIGRRTRDILRSYDRGRCADDAVELPDSAHAGGERFAVGPGAGHGRWARASTMCEARRGVRSRSGRRRVWRGSGSRHRVD